MDKKLIETPEELNLGFEPPKMSRLVSFFAYTGFILLNLVSGMTILVFRSILPIQEVSLTVTIVYLAAIIFYGRYLAFYKNKRPFYIAASVYVISTIIIFTHFKSLTAGYISLWFLPISSEIGLLMQTNYAFTRYVIILTPLLLLVGLVFGYIFTRKMRFYFITVGMLFVFAFIVLFNWQMFEIDLDKVERIEFRANSEIVYVNLKRDVLLITSSLKEAEPLLWASPACPFGLPITLYEGKKKVTIEFGTDGCGLLQFKDAYFSLPKETFLKMESDIKRLGVDLEAVRG